MLKQFLTRSENAAEAPWSLKEALSAASVTQPGSNVRKLPLDVLAKQARNATPRVIEAQCKLDKLESGYKDAVAEAEAYLIKLKEEFETQIDSARCELQKAEHDRKQAQYLFTREAIETDVYIGIKDISELARSKEFESK